MCKIPAGAILPAAAALSRSAPSHVAGHALATERICLGIHGLSNERVYALYEQNCCLYERPLMSWLRQCDLQGCAESVGCSREELDED